MHFSMKAQVIIGCSVSVTSKVMESFYHYVETVPSIKVEVDGRMLIKVYDFRFNNLEEGLVNCASALPSTTLMWSKGVILFSFG